ASTEDWKPDVPARKWNSIVLHHTGTPTGNVEAIEADHRQRTDSAGQPWLGIGYHFVIGNGQGLADGRVEPTFRWRQQLHGAHAGDRQYNQEGIGICLVGDFSASPPTARQIDALKRLVAWLGRQYSIDRESVVRHSDVAATECPGSQFPWETLFARETGTLVP
ncbi:MAG TPA: peptidoglycan recognition family protein, partial [Pirellulales bacterium]|nr:peptidoglycan recognition family protein [Pirellulales bacterium]